MDRDTQTKIRRVKQKENEEELIRLNHEAKKAGMSYGQYVALISSPHHHFSSRLD